MEYAFEAYTALSGKLQLQPEMGLDALSGTLDRFWDEMLLDIVPLVSDIHVRSAYQILIRQAKAQAQAFTWLEQPEVFQSFAPGSVQKPRKPWLGLAAILILAGLTVWFLLPISGKNPVAAGLCGASALLVAVQYILVLFDAQAARADAPTIQTRAEQRISPRRVQSSLQQAVRQIDGNAETFTGTVTAGDGVTAELLRESGTASGEVDVSLPKELLRLPPDLRSSAVSDAVDRYLARLGVEKVNYSPEQAALFMLLPSAREGTVEPALVKDGQVLSQGVACVNTEG